MHHRFDVGGTKTALDAFDKQHRLQWKIRVPTSYDSYDAFFDAVCNLMAKADQWFGIKGSIGVGTPGTPETEGGMLYTANVPAADDESSRVNLGVRLDRDVRLDNDANCFALSEAWDDELTQYPLVMGLILGTGVGGSLVLSGEPITGRNYITGEFGHIHLSVDALILMGFNFPPRRCGCGQLGRIESYLSGGGFAWLYQHYYHQPLDVRETTALWEQDDEHVLAHVECYLDLLAVCLGNILTIVDPDLVVIDGGLSSFTAITTQLASRLPRHLLPVVRTPYTEQARHDDAGGMRGATFLHLTGQYKEVVMLSRRGHRLNRFRRDKRHLCDCLRQWTFFGDRVAPELIGKPRVLVLIRAGISAESGTRTFRAADGFWEEHRIENVATPEEFNRNPELVQSFYNARRHQLQQPEIQSNAAHIVLAKLEAELGDRFLLVTQNIDNPHERAGSQNVIHMYGELLRVRCSQSRQILEWAGDVTPEDKCYRCQFLAPLRPHVVWFGEMPLGMDEIYMALAIADVSVAIGTSGHVYPTTGFMYEVWLYGAYMVKLNPEPSQMGSEFEEKYYGLANQVMPEFIGKLLKGL